VDAQQHHERLSQSPNAAIVCGNLLDQHVDAIVNAWNRNVIPWWLLLPQGVSGAIRREAGTQPFRELAKLGPIPLGQAVMTSPGRLSFKSIIHVAGINLFWRATEYSIRQSVSNAIDLAERASYESIAFPAIGAGSGGFGVEKSLELMSDELGRLQPAVQVTLVRFSKEKQ